jgi:hypothetical protein
VRERQHLQGHEVQIALALALAFSVEDVTLPNGVRVIVAQKEGPAATAKSPDGRVIAIVGAVSPDEARKPYGRENAIVARAPAAPPDGELWALERGAPSLAIEFAAPPPESLLALAALYGASPRVGERARLERDGEVARLTVVGGWPPESRRAIEGAADRLAAPAVLAEARARCVEWATPKTNDALAQRLVDVTLATGNPRLLREAADRCGRITVELARTAAHGPRRVRLVIPP